MGKSTPFFILLFVFVVIYYASSEPVDRAKQVVHRNNYIQSVRHFLQDFKNMAGGFMSNRLDRLEHKRQLVKQKVKNIFRQLLAPFRRKSV